MVPSTVPMLQTLPYDNLGVFEKPKPYKEGGATIKSDTFSGFEDKTKALTFLQQFDSAYSKVRKAVTFLKGNARTC